MYDRHQHHQHHQHLHHHHQQQQQQREFLLTLHRFVFSEERNVRIESVVSEESKLREQNIIFRPRDDTILYSTVTVTITVG